VRLLHDPNGDGELDDAVVLATGAFDAIDGVAGLALSAPLTLPAGEEQRLAVVVDVPAGTASSWPAQLAVFFGGASLWFWRRRRPLTAIAAILALSLLVACGRPAGPLPLPQSERVTYAFALEQVEADGASTVQGLPLEGVRLTVQRTQ
jgi:predicted small lipoprotein YifL